VVRDAAQGDDPTAHRLMHAHCRQQEQRNRQQVQPIQ
jgi:RNA-directed DNA polymerase